jgi:hypothetical protein
MLLSLKEKHQLVSALMLSDMTENAVGERTGGYLKCHTTNSNNEKWNKKLLF